jgi:hypothetical protein
MFLPETGSGGGDTADQRRDTAFRAASLVAESLPQQDSAGAGSSLQQQGSAAGAGVGVPQQGSVTGAGSPLQQQGSAAGAGVGSPQQVGTTTGAGAPPQQPELPALWRRVQFPALTV